MSPDTLSQHFDAVADAPNGVQKLRELILQLAVRGKLVPQDPRDEPAVPDSERSWPDLPSNWAVVQLGNVTEIIRGITFPGSAKSGLPEPGTVACLRTASVQDEIDWDDLIFVSDEYVKRQDQWVCPGDLIISMANSLELVGKVALVRDVPQRASFGGFLAAIRPSRAVEPQFLFVLLRSPEMLQTIRSTASRTTNIANVSLKGLRPIELPIPPLAEQRSIVEKVDQLMAFCDELEARQQRRTEKRVLLNRASLHHLTAATDDAEVAEHWQRIRDNFHLLYDAPETVAELRQAILQLAVRGKLVPQDPSDEPASALLERIEAGRERLSASHNLQASPRQPDVDEGEIEFPVPTNWAWVRFGSFLDIQGGSQPPKSNFSDDPREGYVRLLQIRDFGTKPVPTYVPEDAVTRFCSEGDVMLARYGASVGKIFMGQQGAYNVALTKIIFDKTLLYNRFIYFLLQADQFQSYLAEASRSAQAGFNRGNLHPIPLPLPPVAEQRRIVEKVDQLMALCDEMEAKLTRSRTRAEKLASAVVHHLTAA